MRDVVRVLANDLANGKPVLLCQVVETRGSTPQKAGALMIVRPDGSQVGTLGGGCVEAEVKQKAIRRLDQPGAELHSYVLDHDYAWADGLICGGKMVILTEMLRGPAAAAYFDAWKLQHERGQGFSEAIVLDPERAGVEVLGSRWLFDADGRCVADWNGRGEPPSTPEPLEGRPRPAVRDGLAWLPSLPRIRLVIVGAGHVGQAVASLAARADFDVWVVDDRAQYANPERFPDAQRLLVGPIDRILSELDMDRPTYALVVTRGHGHDQEALYHLAPTTAEYVGLIGSRRKIRMIFENLRDQGIPEEALARVCAPVGLEIGSESVIEIAISIVAELIAWRNLGPRAARSVRLGAETTR
ncbi:MAG: xanthine dehydrogenase [Isosphaeraceae bacterium]|jgi:xanthine dehydrogenase accessory factor|nr:MAG: xanthine dehydrogenase [Isosphaeraceae bacterium]